MKFKVARRAVLRGKVIIGEGTVVEDNAILGSSDKGEVTIGKNSLIRSGSIIYSNVRIGDNFRSGHNVLVRENSVIDDNVLLGTNSVVEGDCRIGKGVIIQTGVYITRFTIVEDDVFMGPLCVTTNDKYMQYGVELIGPIIKKKAKIGANSTILPGITVGQNAIVGAGAVVTKDVANDDVVAGNPAASIRRKRDD